MIFSQAIEKIDSEITELIAQIEAKKQQQSALMELDAVTDSALDQMEAVVSKIRHYRPDAICASQQRNALAQLKRAVLELFRDGDDGGNQPTDPPHNTPSPDEDEPEIIALNGITGDCLTAHPHEAELNGQAYEWACPFACPVEYFPQPQKPVTELIHTSARTGYLKLKGSDNPNGIPSDRIFAAYAWFSRKADAQAWASDIEVIPDAKTEMRLSQRNSSWKWELKITGLSMTQIERLSKEDLSRKPYKDYASSIPPSYKKPERKLPVNPGEVKSGDIVTALLTPSASYKIIQIMPNGILDCENLTTGDRLGLRPTAVTLVQKGEETAA